jgi:biofilm PGA synthesis protein PgaA
MTSRPRFSLLFILLAAHGMAGASDAEKAGDWAIVLGTSLKTLEQAPSNPEARKSAWRAAMRLGLFDQAAALEAPLDAKEQRAMEGDRIALAIRHGIIDRNTLRGPERFFRLDSALTVTDALAADFLAGQTPDGEDLRRLTDRISGLATRRRAADAVILYETFIARGMPVPLWAKRDVAGSYLELRKPRHSASLYQEVVAANLDDFDANLGLFYALVEMEELDAASAHIDAFAARLPERRNRDGKYNGERLSSDITADQARLYSDRLKEAQARNSARRSAAPYNSEARQTSASLALARGWPNLGEQLLQRVEGSDPKNPAIHADLAETRLSLQNWPTAQASLEQANALDSQHGAVKRAKLSFDLHNRYELSIDAGFGKGDGGASYFGNSDWHVDTWLYSRPLADNWRIFLHNYTTTADFDSSKTDWIRNGLGAEWRWQNWRITGEVNGGSNESAGLTGTARWKPDDYWTVSASAESRTNDIPLRAVRDGVTASQASVSIDWRAHESRKLSIGTSFYDFSDGNQRSAISAAWQERWHSSPRWMFETTLGADASHNTLDSGFSYFNPKNDHSVWLTPAIEHLGWRNYEYAFRHRLALTMGRYWQMEKDLEPGNISAIEYTHRWELDRDLSLRYGIGRSLRPYDGVREARNFGSLSLLWRF